MNVWIMDHTRRRRRRNEIIPPRTPDLVKMLPRSRANLPASAGRTCLERRSSSSATQSIWLSSSPMLSTQVTKPRCQLLPLGEAVEKEVKRWSDQPGLYISHDTEDHLQILGNHYISIHHITTMRTKSKSNPSFHGQSRRIDYAGQSVE